LIDWHSGQHFTLSLTLPDNVAATLDLPAPPDARGVYINGQPVKASLAGERWVLESNITGDVTVEVK
jgi:hypothetical protein